MIYIVVTFLIGIILAWLFQFNWKRQHMYKLSKEVDGPKPLPFLGNAYRFLQITPDGFFDELIKICREYPSPFRIWLGPKLVYIIADPANLKIILNSPLGLVKDKIYANALRLVGEGLIVAPVAAWKKTRKTLAPFFGSKIILDFNEALGRIATSWVEDDLIKIVGKGHVDVLDYVRRYTLSCTFEASVGVDISKQTKGDLICWIKRGLEIISKRLSKFWLHPDFIFNLTSEANELKLLEANICNIIDRIISERKDFYRNKSQAEPAENDNEQNESKTLLHFITNRPQELKDVQLKAEIRTFILVGFDTIATASAFALVMLGMHQDKQRKLYKEIIKVLSPDHTLKQSDLPKLQYLDWIIKETLRLFPSTPVMLHKADMDIKLATCTLPSGSSVLVPICQLHRNEKYWPDPLKFIPERFSSENIATKHPYSYLPFYAGPRNCLGQKFAILSMKTLIATVVRKFTIETAYKSVEDINLRADVVLYPIDGHKIALKLRN